MVRSFRYAIAILFIVFCALSTQWSCTETSSIDAEIETSCSVFLDTVMKQSTIGKREGFQWRVDSFFAAHPNVSLLCSLQKLIVLTRIYIDGHQYDSAWLYIDSALQLYENNGLAKENQQQYMGLLIAKGEVLYASGGHNEAYNYYFRARMIASELNDSCIVHNNDYVLAMICYNQQKYRDAIRYFRGALWLSGNCEQGLEITQQENLDNIGLCYARMGISDSALLHYDSALAVIERSKDQVFPITYHKALAVAQGNKGTLLMTTGQYDSAIVLLNNSYALNIQPGHDNTDALVTHLKMALLWQMQHEWSKVADALVKIRAELDTIYHTTKEEAEWVRLSAILEEKNGNYAAASNYYKRFITLKDSLNEQQKRLVASDINKELERKESQYKMQLLEEQSRLNSVYLWVATGFLSMALIIALLLYRNYRKSRKNVQVLTSLNDRIVAQKAMLEEKNREKDHILHVVAHDLRNPIGGIRALSQRLMKNNEVQGDLKQLKMIEKTSENALELIGELLELNTDDENIMRQPADLNDLVLQTVTLLQPMAVAKQQVLEAILPQTEMILPVNTGKILRLLNNLVSNAIKFTPRLGTITVAVMRTGDYAQIDVCDTGVGIPEDLLHSVFDTFTAARRSGTEGEKPFGLGLSICRQIADAHGGTISVKSKHNCGTTFTVRLPLR